MSIATNHPRSVGLFMVTVDADDISESKQTGGTSGNSITVMGISKLVTAEKLSHE